MGEETEYYGTLSFRKNMAVVCTNSLQLTALILIHHRPINALSWTGEVLKGPHHSLKTQLVSSLVGSVAAELWASSAHHLDTAGIPDTPEVQKLEDQNIQLMLDLSQVTGPPCRYQTLCQNNKPKVRSLSLSECLQVVNGSQWGQSSCGLTLP